MKITKKGKSASQTRICPSFWPVWCRLVSSKSCKKVVVVSPFYFILCCLLPSGTTYCVLLVQWLHCRKKFSTQLTCHHIGSNPFISLLPHSSQRFVLHQGKKKIVVKLLSSQKVCCQLLTLRTLPKRCPILISFQKIPASFDQ